MPLICEREEVSAKCAASVPAAARTGM